MSTWLSNTASPLRGITFNLSQCDGSYRGDYTAVRKYNLKDEEIPDEYQIFEKRLEVAGVSHERENAIVFVESKDPWLKLEREEGNKYDKNAIIIVACIKG